MNKTLTRLFTLMLLMMVSLGARAEVKVLFGEKGTDKYEGKGGTIQVKQEESRDGGKVTVRLAFIPDKNYTFDEQSLEVYKVFSPESAATRALEIDGDALKLEEDKSTNPSEKHYHVDIDSKLALRVKEAQFISESKADPTSSGDYSGTYYIGSVGYKEANTTTNYYLCPTEGWCYYQATDNYTGTDNGMPFLTTYQCRDGVYDVRKAIWVVDKYDSEYYTIKRAYDGKYIVFNGQIKTTSNPDRMRMHVEALSAVNDNALFKFVYNSKTNAYNIKPKNSADDRYWTTNGGNKPSLIGESGKTGGPSRFGNTAGIIGIYTISDNNNSYFLEEAIVPPTFTINADGSVELSSLEGTSIRYTTDSTTPTAESTAYTAAIQVTSTMTSIKAIAIRTSDNKASDAVTLPLHTYTYYIVNKSGDIAIKQVVKQAEGKALGSMADIPADIRSPYLIGETVKFYSFDEAFTSAEQLTDEVKISATPQDDANIYVTYTTDHLSEKFLRLQGKRAFNIVTNGEYAYDNGGTLAYDDNAANKTQPSHLWNISGGDPYAVQIKNLDPHKYLVSSTMPTLSLAGTATNNFILMEQSAATDAGFESVKLMKATGTGTLEETKAEFQASPVNITTKYNLIDKACKLIQGNIESESSELGLPDEWRSPLVSEYHYYKTSGYDETTQTYTPANPITSPFDADGGMIYVTYDVSDAVDLTGGKTYLLKFLNGVSFNQENGSDGILSTPTKAIYPYNNGDFNLYVYGQEQWDKQLGDGASTRSRWLWYIVSNSDSADPYHVIFKSFQNQQIKYNNVNYAGAAYLRTYKPEGYASVVTGTTYKNTGGYKDALPTDEQEGCLPTDEPTEYMILGTSISSMTLKTVLPVDGSRRIVDSFEQYWKNNPTVEELVGATPNADNAILTGKTWHSYKQWAYSAPWGGGSKAYAKGDHWFQTIKMGTGENAGKFTVEAVDLAPQVILIDQHGWEIMRIPLSDTETLRKYDSPMVEKYQWYPTALKTGGYHKYRVSDPKIKIYKYAQKPNSTSYDWIESGTYYENPELDENDEKKYLYTSTTLADSPYGHITTPACEKPECTDPSHSSQPDKVKTDFYVTYTVKDAYARNYQGAATEEAVVPSSYLLKQGGYYATFSGSGTAIGTVATKPSRESVTDNILWNLKPNFKIDEEMGFEYGTGDASKSSIESAYYAAGQNGFDPYNVQIQNKKYQQRYFTANTTGSDLNGGVWAGTSSTMSLQNMGTKQTATGYDQTTLNITNATFMVVSDGNGNMRLMPRFDQGKVMQSFGTLATQAAATSAGDEGTGTQTLYLESVAEAKEIHSSDEITDLNGNYLLASDFDFTGFTSLGSSSKPFTGIIDGQLNTFTGLKVPLVANANGAIIKNIILKDVAISQSGNVGAICCNANGATRIYNCGILPTTNEHATTDRSTVTSTDGHCGSLVGNLDGYARVINCFSYANVAAGSSNNAGGIVGNNTTATMQGNNQTNFNNNVKTMVVNCMFYGDITAGSTIRPVYGGTAIVNNAADKVNNYNYFCEEEASFDDNYTAISDYNYSWPVAKKYLTRFEVYRNILNTNRRLCTWWVNGTYNVAPTDDDVETVGIAKWVLDQSIAPYPILKEWGKYYSSFYLDPDQVWNPEKKKMVQRSSAKEWEGKDLGTINVTIKAGTNNSSAEDVTIPITITDMDSLNCDYCAKKIQLPYYNEVFGDPNANTWAKKYGNNYTNKVVTGWKVTSVTGGTSITNNTGIDENGIAYDHTFKKAWEDGYNFADRYCTDKDKFEVSGRVFAQGGYYYVPDGVESITIEAYWGDAVYLCNSSRRLDRVNNGNDDFYNSGQLPEKVGGVSTNPAVKTSLSDAVTALKTVSSERATVYDQAIVLVGNYQDYNFHGAIALKGNEYDSNAKPFTIMSADFDFDNEPDFCFQGGMNNGGRINVHPIRFDFLMVPDITMAIRTSATYWGMRIWCPQGHFEITETSFMYTTQFEYDERNADQYKKHEAPMILNGGEHMQLVSSEAFGEAKSNETATSRVDATSYFLMGGKAYVKAFTPGCHGNKKIGTRHCAVNAIGGEYPEFYLSGMFRTDFYNMTDNPHAYLDGGKFGLVAGAGMESIGGKDETNGGDVTFKINHSIIKEFYGGGINANRPVTGNISVTCDNSIVHKYCGGPKVGDMSNTKTITTNATGSTFDQYYGGGNGGTNNERRRIYDSNGPVDAPTDANKSTAWNGSTGGFDSFSPFRLSGDAYETEFEFELLPDTRGNGKVVKRTYSYWATFARTTVAPITNIVTDCTFNNSFYGGGNLGAVDGTVTSTLKGNTVVHGSAYGAGFSASIPTFQVHDKSTVVYPYRDKSGFIHDGSLQHSSIKYHWIHDVPSDWGKTPNVSTKTDLVFQYPADNGEWYVYTPVSLTGLGTVNGNATLTIKGTTEVKGDVFGGGAQSAVSGNTTVNIEGNAQVLGNIFGGGDEGDVEGSATVNIRETPATP